MDFYQSVCKKPKICESLIRRLFGTVTHVSTDRHIAALTFDDGPHPASTPRLLKILKSHKAKATFFMVGQAAKKYPELVQDVAKAGHTVGNHSFSHVPFTSISRRKRVQDVKSCQETLAPYGTKIFRPPLGYQNIGSRIDLMLLGYKVVAWSVSSRDWHHFDCRQIAAHLLSKVHPGSIVLLHDAIYDSTEKEGEERRIMLDAIGLFLERSEQHYSFVTLPELFSMGKPQKTHWFRGDSQEAAH